MKIMQKLYGWYGKRAVLITIVVIVAIIAVGLLSSGADTKVGAVETLPSVRLTTASALYRTDSLQLLGTVRSISEVEITPERGGKVTRVGVTLGSQVRTGQIIVELENASERASLLQAEGAYEGALAAAASSNVGTKEAEIRLSDARNNLDVTINSAYTTAQNVLINTLDSNFYASSNSTYPSLRINTLDNNEFLRSERLSMQTVLPKLQSNSLLDPTESNLKSSANYAVVQLKRLLNVTDIFLNVINSLKNSSEFIDAQKAQFNTDLKIARDSLVNTISNLEGNVLAIKSAEEGLEKAQISASGGVVSASEAQIKQALGSLRAAQANYAKTILRSPINGTVNSLNVSVGELLNASQPVATIANNGQLEIITFISEKERSLLNVGDKVNIGKNVTGTVSAISQAISTNTGKIEVRIVTDSKDLLNGESVRITKETLAEVTEGPIRIPLTAIRFNGSKGSVYILNENKIIESVAIEIGEIRGPLAEITSGITRDTEFVVDVRGRNVGDEVIVDKQ